MRIIRRTEQHAVGGACRIHQPFELERSDDVLIFAITVFVEFIDVDGTESRGHNDSAVLAFDDLIRHRVIDGTDAALFLAESALARF